MTTFPELREALKARITPLPWRWWTSCSFRRMSSDATGKDGDVLHAARHSDGAMDIASSEQDRALIESAVNAAPAMLAHIDAQAAEIERLREALKAAELRFISLRLPNAAANVRAALEQTK